MLSKGTILDPYGVPLNDHYATLKNIGEALRAADLMRYAREHPPEPMILGLLNKGDIMLLHGSEECFKSVLVLQIAENLALGTALLNHWKVPQARRVGVIETEIHEVMLGERLSKMFPKGDAPKNLLFMPESTMREWRRLILLHKFESIQKWIAQNDIDVLMIDTANDFFRGAQNPSDERNVGQFFDELRNLNVGARIIVRHDRKQSLEPHREMSSNENIRGSGEWKEDPEAIIALRRKDRRTHEVSLEVGKLRYGAKPDAVSLWFDLKTFRLTALPPVIEILSAGEREKRETIVARCIERFGLGERKVDDMLGQQAQFLKERMNGHSKEFEIDLDKVDQAPWCGFLFGS
jgi:RecA-family ATPase